MLMLSTTFCN